MLLIRDLHDPCFPEYFIKKLFEMLGPFLNVHSGIGVGSCYRHVNVTVSSHGPEAA